MSSETSARLNLPLIQPGQAQKELSHNEALTLIDVLMQPGVVAMGTNLPPTTPLPGQSWIVGAAPTGAWAGQAKRIAAWTEGGWRFIAPIEGMTSWIAEVQQIARYSGGSWAAGELRGTALSIDGVHVIGARRSAIGNATGGVTIDTEARAAINAVLAALRGHGLIQT